MKGKLNKIFINLPVKDLKKSMDFFATLGFTFNPQFTDQNAACLIISDDIFAMLAVEDFFKGFTKVAIADSEKNAEVILALSAESKESVDEIVDKALAAGAKAYSDTGEQDFMYSRGFQDPDNHRWEIFYMDPGSVDWNLA